MERGTIHPGMPMKLGNEVPRETPQEGNAAIETLRTSRFWAGRNDGRCWASGRKTENVLVLCLCIMVSDLVFIWCLCVCLLLVFFFLWLFFKNSNLFGVFVCSVCLFAFYRERERKGWEFSWWGVGKDLGGVVGNHDQNRLHEKQFSIKMF